MKYKLLLGIALTITVLIFTIYTLTSKDASTKSIEHFDSGSTDMNSQNSAVEIGINPFQQRLDQQQRGSTGVVEPQSGSQYPPGHDPFKAFLDAQDKQRNEQARQSPFGK